MSLPEGNVGSYAHMHHGAGIFNYIWVTVRANVDKCSSTMVHMGWVDRASKKVGSFKFPTK
jgi:hypothetical protein